ncbi:MAG: hypothetical protein RIR52_128, partial [Acidobacteriota bacterium]
ARDKITVQLGDQQLPVTFIGPAPGFSGVDQVNLPLPRSLAGRGISNLHLVVDGRTSNQVVLLF